MTHAHLFDKRQCEAMSGKISHNCRCDSGRFPDIPITWLYEPNERPVRVVRILHGARSVLIR